ncbi:MAG: hypothetical protein GXP29_13995, partial [Planctomycetes bacterium]|nr:hypothetical protein [Planctomycetota bacterium]
MRAESVSRFSDDRIDEAVIAVRLDSGFDAIDAVDRYQPDVRVVLRSGNLPDATGSVLFDGYPQKLISDRDGNPKRRSDELTIEAVGVYSRWARDARSWIFGRRMRNAAILDTMVLDPVGQAANSVLVEALPCVFNDNGQPNRSPTPILLNDGDGTPRRIYVFTYEGDPAAESWSLLDALRYLVWFHRLPEGPVLSA